MIDARMGLKGSAAAFAAVAAASGGATAADVSGFRPSPVAAPTWDGFYAGASLGASWLNSTQDPSGLNIGGQGGPGNLLIGSTGGTSTTTNVPGIIGGLQFGYNWQHANFVYGLETDISWIGSNSATSNGNFFFSNGRYSATSVTTSRVDALATFRARFGIDFNGTLPYLTAGFALGHLQNNFALTAYNGAVVSPSSVSTFGNSGSSWVPGIVVGGGIEHQLTRQWTLRGELMWVGFESQQLGNPLPALALGYGGAINHGGAAKISDNLTIGKIGLNYRF